MQRQERFVNECVNLVNEGATTTEGRRGSWRAKVSRGSIPAMGCRKHACTHAGVPIVAPTVVATWLKRGSRAQRRTLDALNAEGRGGGRVGRRRMVRQVEEREAHIGASNPARKLHLDLPHQPVSLIPPHALHLDASPAAAALAGVERRQRLCWYKGWLAWVRVGGALGLGSGLGLGPGPGLGPGLGLGVRARVAGQG